MDGNGLTPSSCSKADNNTPTSILPPDPALSPVASASPNSTPPAASEVNNHPQSLIYCPRPDWSESNLYNTSVNNSSADLTQRSESNTLSISTTYCPEPPWSESNEYYHLSTDPSQRSESFTLPINAAYCPRPHWAESNVYYNSSADLTQRSESNDLLPNAMYYPQPEQGSIYNPQLDWPESNPFTSTVSGTARI